MPPITPLEQKKLDELEARKRQHLHLPGGGAVCADLAKALMALIFLIVFGPIFIGLIFFGLQGLLMAGVPTLLVLILLAICKVI